MIAGHFCDGGPHGYSYNAATSTVKEGSPAGWSLFDSADIGSLKAITSVTVGPTVMEGRMYDRALYITECVGNWRAGVQPHHQQERRRVR